MRKVWFNKEQGDPSKHSVMGLVLCLLIALYLSRSSCEAAAIFNHYPIVYNFYDVLAQSSCAASASKDVRIWALRRSCVHHNKTCDEICGNHTLTCFHAYHVFKNPTILLENRDEQTDEGVPGLSMFSYSNGCQHPVCGPNYCCCKGPNDALEN